MRSGSTYAIASWLFLRLLGIVYTVAFWSLARQIPGLIGSGGIQPAAEYLSDAAGWTGAFGTGIYRYLLLPTVFWIDAGDRVLQGVAYGGAALGLLLAAGVAPLAILPLLWIGYLSLAVVGGEFLAYQWDSLLLEAGFLAIFLAPPVLRDRLRGAPDPPRLARWLLWWLLLRLMAGSGIVKVASGDPAWHDLTALAFHYETQPLPTPIAWYAAALPALVHRVSTALTLGIELAAFCLLVPRLRRVSAVVLISLQAMIALTGNYGFFNLLAISLCVLLLDDEALAFGRTSTARLPNRGRWARWAPAGAAALTFPISAALFAGQIGLGLPAFIRPLYDAASPFRSINPYGLFAVMTTRRLEIEVEGSVDGLTWRPYVFRYKPGPLDRPPPWIAPFQPRLDWQMWFAALGRYEREIWFQRFARRLLEASPPVLALLERDPFGGRPPRFIRATLYQYRFTDAGTAGAWWTRERVRAYGAATATSTTGTKSWWLVDSG